MTPNDWKKSNDNDQIFWQENLQQTKGMRIQSRSLYYSDLESLVKLIATWETHHILNLGILQQILHPEHFMMPFPKLLSLKLCCYYYWPLLYNARLLISWRPTRLQYTTNLYSSHCMSVPFQL